MKMSIKCLQWLVVKFWIVDCEILCQLSEAFLKAFFYGLKDIKTLKGMEERWKALHKKKEENNFLWSEVFKNFFAL